jgi:hypothetical protein
VTTNYFNQSFDSFRTIAVLVALILKIDKLLIGIKDIHTLQVVFTRHGVKFVVLLILNRMLRKRFWLTKRPLGNTPPYRSI